MFTAYLDESGQETNDWVFIAGFLGKEKQWQNFIPAWKDALGPQRRSLHVADFRFKKDRERRLLEKLAPIPVGCGLEPLLGGIRVSDYEDLLDPFLGKLNCGYVSALLPLLVQILRWMPPDERLEIIFEQQDRYAGVANFTLENISTLEGFIMQTSDGKPKLAKWSFVPKGSTCLTEPADYLGFAVAQYYKDKNSIKSKWCMPILRSVDTVQAIGAIMNREHARLEVTQLLNKLKEENIVLPKTSGEFEKFRALANQVLQVPHAEIRAKLKTEKQAKKQKKSRKSSTSRAANAKG